MDCSVQAQIRGGRKKEQWIECSSHFTVLSTIWFNIIVLVCIMIVHSYCMVMHIEWSVQVHVRQEARRRNGDCFQIIVLCCVLFDSRLLHWLHKGEFLVIAWWCILGCSVQVQIREGSKKEK